MNTLQVPTSIEGTIHSYPRDWSLRSSENNKDKVKKCLGWKHSSFN